MKSLVTWTKFLMKMANTNSITVSCLPFVGGKCVGKILGERRWGWLGCIGVFLCSGSVLEFFFLFLGKRKAERGNWGRWGENLLVFLVPFFLSFLYLMVLSVGSNRKGRESNGVESASFFVVPLVLWGREPRDVFWAKKWSLCVLFLFLSRAEKKERAERVKLREWRVLLVPSQERAERDVKKVNGIWLPKMIILTKWQEGSLR